MAKKHMEWVVWIALATITGGYVAANSFRPHLPSGISWADVRIAIGAVGLALWFVGLRLRRTN